MRTTVSHLAMGFLLLTGAMAQGQTSVFPDLIQLPSGFGPEGIAIGNGSTFYVGAGLGSQAGILGQILVGDLRTGTYSQLVPPSGRPALGIKFDSRSALLFVAGGPSGTGRVYDANSGAQVAFYQFRVPAPTGPRGTNVNDVIVTKDAVYFTDSVAAFLYRVELGKNHLPSTSFDQIPLPSVAFGTPAGTCASGARANGIVSDPSGKFLIIGNSNAGQLFRMDTATFTVQTVSLTGGNVCNADGLLLDGGRTLYVVQNVDNRIAVIDMDRDLLSGRILRYIVDPFETNPATKVPTTIAEFGKSLYAVTGGFAPPAPDFVVRLDK